jgi:hypothetical protein
MVSKNFDVAVWTAKLLSKLALDFSENNLLMNAWEWFVSDNGGLPTCLLGLKRHPDLKDSVVNILLQFAKFNFVELFTTHLKKSLPDPKDLITTIS